MIVWSQPTGLHAEAELQAGDPVPGAQRQDYGFLIFRLLRGCKGVIFWFMMIIYEFKDTSLNVEIFLECVAQDLKLNYGIRD